MIQYIYFCDFILSLAEFITAIATLSACDPFQESSDLALCAVLASFTKFKKLSIRPNCKPGPTHLLPSFGEEDLDLRDST